MATLVYRKSRLGNFSWIGIPRRVFQALGSPRSDGRQTDDMLQRIISLDSIDICIEESFPAVAAFIGVYRHPKIFIDMCRCAGKYGYEHRRSHGDEDMRVDNSVELVFVPTTSDEDRSTSDQDRSTSDQDRELRCAVCAEAMGADEDPAAHVRAMAQPLECELAWRCERGDPWSDVDRFCPDVDRF